MQQHNLRDYPDEKFALIEYNICYVVGIESETGDGVVVVQKILAATVAALALSTASFAEEAVDGAEAVQGFDWSGFYVGASVGWAEMDPQSTKPNLLQPKSEGIETGLHAGYDLRFGYVLAGVVGEISASDTEAATSCANPLFRCSAESDWTASLRARAGVPIGRFLGYVTGGLAWMDYSGSTSIVTTGQTFEDSKTLSGWTAGGGIDFAVTDRLVSGVEVLYYDFDGADLQYDIPYGVDPDRLSVRAKFSIKF